jgi:hypothetical protein
MQIPDFDLPPWVCWIAQDADGAWWGYECEPLQHDHGWYENEVGRYIKLGLLNANAHWWSTLTRVK